MINSLLFFITIISVNAFASKARVQALSNSLHLIDSQTIYKNPLDLLGLENFVSAEMGLTAATSLVDGAEAMISYGFKENQRLAFSVGHQDESVTDARIFINTLTTANFELAQNPLYVFYSIEDSLTSYAMGISYSGKSDKVTGLKESSASLSAGAEMGNLQISSLYTFVNSAEALAGKKLDASGYWQTTLSYLLESTTVEFKYITSRAKMSTELGALKNDNELHVKNVITLGLADLSSRDGSDFFWGAEVVSTSINCKINLSSGCNKNFTRTVLPAWFGVETEVSDWLIFRGAVKQSFLINITKDEFGYPASIVSGATGVTSNIASGENDTMISSGLGFKFKNLIFDGTLASSSTQKFDLTNFLSQASLTYLF